MPVTDGQVAVLRALLADDQDLYKQLYARLDRDRDSGGYAAMINGAFARAVQRRFGNQHQPADVIEFVADARSRSGRLAQEIDPGIAERVIHLVLGDGSVTGVSKTALASTQLLLLGALVADEHFDDAGLDAFLASSRKLADQIMG
jgi:hypothetical protein